MTSSHDVAPFAVGDIVETTKGAKFWGQVVSVYRVPKLFSGTDWRCDVYATDPGFEGTLHVYPATQLAIRDDARPGAADPWRNLPLQFDGHRIEALSMLRYAVRQIEEYATVRDILREPLAQLRDFLAKPPQSGEAVLAERIAALAPASAPVGVTEERLEKAARAIMEQDACGYTINGLRCLCDDALSEGLVDGYNKPLRQSICGCRESAKAALTAALTEVSNAG